ncbi:hypothetical protein HID58_079382 [Brassica napus]|uniref:Uncharacterized protein n=1 Tax=Brassica napus TaxID=3708 RepID=A0ABQ7Y1W2_BRANA|nr:hypothetical protein HID58_079382 [Brassica napus]
MSMSTTLDQARWLHQNGTEVKHSLETQIPIGATFITIGIQRSQCRPNHNPCSDHVRAPLTPPMTIVRIKYSSVRSILSLIRILILCVMNFFETYEFSHQLTTRSSRKPISSPRSLKICTIEHKLCVIWRVEKDLTSSTFHLISNHTREGVLQEPSLSLKSYMGKLSISLGHVNWYTDTRLLSFCQLLRWELLVGGDCIFHIIGIAHDKSSWLLDDFLQSFMKAHGPLKISAIGNWSVLLQCQMTCCAAIVPNTKCISVKLSKANTIQLFFFVCVLYIKRTRFSGEIELRYLIGKTLMEPLSYASSE